MKKIILIDNYDSFTFNLYHYLSSLKIKVDVIRNDQITSNQILKSKYNKIVISPGPGSPDNAGNSIALIDTFSQRIPILGVCLGHQCIVQYFGGNIVRSTQLMHGKASNINHDEKTIFRDVANPFSAGRYHSLTAEPKSIPNMLVITATSENQEIMAIRHKELPIEGVQFHPESILTPEGPMIIRNFIEGTNYE